MRPVAALLLGAAAWGLIWYPMRLLELRGLSGLWLAFLLYFAALIASLPWIWRSVDDFRRSPGLMWLIALTSGWTNVAFVLAVLEGNILRVMLLFYLSPVWAVLLGRWFLGERVSPASVLALMLAGGGALAMLWNPTVGLPWPESRADWLGLTAGFAFAASNVAVRHARALSMGSKALSAWIGVSLVALVWALVSEAPLPSVAPMTYVYASALGVGAVLGMTVLVQYGVAHMPVQRSAVIMLFELIVGALSQQLLTDETLGWLEWAGGGFIALGAYVAARAPAVVVAGNSGLSSPREGSGRG